MSNRPRKRNKTLIYVLLGALALLIIAAIIKGRQKPKGVEVYTEKAARRTIRETVTASGKIFPETEVKISSDVSGEIVQLFVKEGDSVTIGQVLAKIRPDQYQSAVEQGVASVNTAKAQKQISFSNVKSSAAQLEQLKADVTRNLAIVENANTAFNRADKLFKEGVISSADYETARNNLRTAESALKAAEANLQASESSLASAQENVRVSDLGITSASARLRELQTSLQKTIITAPVSGIISKLNVEKGERVVGTLQMTGTEMMRIANLRSMEVQVDVSENDILKVSVGNQADVEVDAYLGRKFKGIVTEIANSASNVGASTTLNSDQVTNFVVKIRVDPNSYQDLLKDGRRYPFRPGMSASVDIFTHDSENSLSVPLIAVTARDEKSDAQKTESKEEEKPNTDQNQKEKKTDLIQEIVFVVQNDTVGVRNVTTGIQDNDFIEITSGLQEGDVVVTGPYSAIARKLKGGTHIKTIDKKKAEEKKE